MPRAEPDLSLAPLRLLTNRFLELYFYCLPARFARQRKGDADRAPARWPARRDPLPGAEGLSRICSQSEFRPVGVDGIYSADFRRGECVS